MMYPKKNRFLVAPLLLVASLIVVFAERSQDGSAAQSRLGIEVNLKKPFFVPAATSGKNTSAFIRLATTAGKTSQAEQVSAIKLAPKMVGDKVELTLYAVYGDTTGITACSDWKALRQTTLATYTLRNGEQVALSQLANIGTGFKDKSLTFTAVPLKTSLSAPTEEGCECCTCGGTECCPNKGKCLGCGSCGDCCCRGEEEM